MADFLNLTEDLPRRCRELMKSLLPNAKAQYRDVTFLLSIMGLGYVTPFDILKQRNEVSLTGETRLLEAFECLIKEDFFVSRFDPDSVLERQWRYGSVTFEEVTKRSELDGSIFTPPDMWPNWEKNILPFNRAKSQTKQKVQPVGTKKILSIFRDALAHGSIRTTAVNEEIVYIVFLSYKDIGNPEKGFKYVGVTPAALESFLIQWFDFLEDNSFKTFMAQNMFPTAAPSPSHVANA